jgi:antirestriction protein ArdC
MRGMTRCADRKEAEMTKQDPHTRITDRILAELEQGARPWLKPWSGGDMATAGRTRPLRATGQPYRGINVLLLWMEAVASGFVSPSWMTYTQAQALGAQVRNGERGAAVVYYGDSNRTVRDDASGEDKEQAFRFLKTTRCSTWRRSTACPSASTLCRNPRPRWSASKRRRLSLPASPRW